MAAGIQIKDLYGNVLVDFVPDGTVYRIDGVLKAGETYVIHEVSAPGGYRVSEDQEFIMPLGQETKEIRFVNYAISSGGGGGGTTPGKRQLSIRKYDPVNQIGVAGAELTVYSVDGSLYLKGITDESGICIYYADRRNLYISGNRGTGWILPEPDRAVPVY